MTAGASPAQKQGPPRGRIFLLDDNPLTVNMLRQFFLQQGFQVAVATDPAQALQADLPFVPEIVILDAMMPGISGFEFASVLRKGMGEDIRIVMLTALRADTDRDRALKSGADVFLSKPVKPGDLLDVVEAQLEAARGGRAGRVLEDVARILAGPGGPDAKIRAIAERVARHARS